MAHPRSHSQPTQQPVQYRYRPNAPARASSTILSGTTQRTTYKNPTSSSHAGSSFIMPTSYDNSEAIVAQPYMQTSANSDVVYDTAFTTGYGLIDQNALALANASPPNGYPSQLSPPLASPWISSNSSVASDVCSAAWSPPLSSMSFPSEQQYQISYMESSSWPLQNFNPYFAKHCISMHEAMPSMEPESSSPVFYPQVPQSWQYQFAEDNLAAAYQSSDYCSSHGSPGSVSEQASASTATVATVKPRSSSILTDSSISSGSSISSKEVASVSPQSQPRGKQFQGQLLEFSTPLGQIKSKGSKSAALPCPLAAYGCTSSFISKNEWKRHINTQHLRLEAWLCDQCPKRDNKREFNRKDLFIQHLKRMHPTSCPAHSIEPQTAKAKPNRKGDKRGKTSKSDDLDPALLMAEERCHIILRQPPAESACLFCLATFSGRGSWEARIDHVVKHMEQYKKEGNEVPEPRSWRADRALEQWLISENVISKVRQRWSVV